MSGGRHDGTSSQNYGGTGRRDLLVGGSSLLAASAFSGSVFSSSANAQVVPATNLTADEAQKIAKDAYIFAFPLNYYYRTIYARSSIPATRRA